MVDIKMDPTARSSSHQSIPVAVIGMSQLRAPCIGFGRTLVDIHVYVEMYGWLRGMSTTAPHCTMSPRRPKISWPRCSRRRLGCFEGFSRPWVTRNDLQTTSEYHRRLKMTSQILLNIGSKDQRRKNLEIQVAKPLASAQDVSKRLSIDECLAHPWVPCSETDGRGLSGGSFEAFRTLKPSAGGEAPEPLVFSLFFILSIIVYYV